MARKRAIASMAVSLVARTQKFVKNIKKALRQVKNFTLGIKKLSIRVAKMGAAFTAVALGGLALFVKQSFASLDSLAKMADVLGIAGDKLRGFQRLARLTGNTTEQMDKVFIQLSKNIAEGALGTGEALEALKLLRLDATKLVRLSPDEIFLRMTKALNTLPLGQVQKLGILADLLGARLVRFINLFDLGVDRIRAGIKESIRLSGSFSGLDLLLIQRANDAFEDMKISLRGIADRLAITIAPAVEALAKRLTEVFVNFRKNLPANLNIAKAFIIGFLNELDRRIRNIGIVITLMAREAVGVLADLFGILPGGGKRSAKLSALAGRLEASALAQTVSLATTALLGDRLANALNSIVESAKAVLVEADVLAKKRRSQQLAFGILETIKLGKALFSSLLAGPAKAAAKKLSPRIPVPTTTAATITSRTFLPGAFSRRNREQLVKDPQLATVIRLLIEANRQEPQVALTS